jgi:hypothetical protein
MTIVEAPGTSGSNSAASGDDSEVSDARIVIREGVVINRERYEETRSTGEEAWTAEAEELALSWNNFCLVKADAQKKLAKKNRTLHVVLGLPAVLIPISLASLSPMIEQQPESSNIFVLGYMVLALLNGINVFFNFEKRKEKNEQYRARFLELSSEVKYQLFKSRRFRVPSDEFLARLQNKMNALNEHKPNN